MNLRFSAHPGRWERQLRRRHRNPLFGDPPPEVGREELDRARARDQQESRQFRNTVEALFEEAMHLKPNEDSGAILRLKERLDQAYERGAALAGGEPTAREGLRRLTAVVMLAVRRGAGADPRALEELDDEEQARALHYTLLEQPLVADLLSPDTPIPPTELLATLLTAEPRELETALGLFEPALLTELVEQGEALLASRGTGLAEKDANLERMRLHARTHRPGPRLN